MQSPEAIPRQAAGRGGEGKAADVLDAKGLEHHRCRPPPLYQNIPTSWYSAVIVDCL